MGYIICEKCGGYYELQPGEHPEDFNKCNCGGKLKYERNMIEDDEYDDPFEKQSWFKLPSSKNLKALGAGAVLVLVLLVKFLPKLLVLSWIFMPNQTFSGYGTPFIYLIPALIIISIVVTRIFRPWRW